MSSNQKVPLKKIHYVRDEIKQNKKLAVKKERKLKLIILVVLSVILVVLAIWGLRQEPVLIKQIKVTGAKTVSVEKIQTLAQAKLTGYFLFLIPRTNVWFYPKDEIRLGLLKEFGYLAEVKLNVRRFTVLDIQVSERKPNFLWCDTLIKTNCYLADETGFIFTLAENKIEEDLFTIYGSPNGSLTLMTKPIGAQKFKQIDLFIKNIPSITEQLSGGKLKINSVVLLSNNDYQFIVTNQGREKSSWDLLISGRSIVQDLALNLETVLTAETFLESINLTDLEYLDFRFGKKVFYKFKSAPDFIETNVITNISSSTNETIID